MYTKETSFSRRMKQTEQHAASLLQQILIFVLIFLVIFMMVQIQNLHGTAHVVNYAGLVRGATQREVKLEITGTADDMQIEYLDKILSSLKYEDGNYNLVSLKDPAYQQCLDNQIEYWELLKEEIYTVREKGYENTNVVSMSETYFEYADETVTAAEQYSEKIAARIRLTEIISALDILLLIFLIVQQQIQQKNPSRFHGEIIATRALFSLSIVRAKNVESSRRFDISPHFRQKRAEPAFSSAEACKPSRFRSRGRFYATKNTRPSV